jgi:hypothetical protein
MLSRLRSDHVLAAGRESFPGALFISFRECSSLSQRSADHSKFHIEWTAAPEMVNRHVRSDLCQIGN